MTPLDHTDISWVAGCVDVVARGEGQPWRVALDQLEHLPQPVAKLRAVIGALRYVIGGRAHGAHLARRARGLVLGAPALARDDRTQRVATAALALGLSEHDFEAALWADLPRERAIVLANGRPQAQEITEVANVHLIQRALRRAHAIELRVWGDAGPLLRTAMAQGLLATASVCREGGTALDVVGPLALLHRTTVYGRALGLLVPLLSAFDDFELDIRGTADHVDRVRAPIALPPPALPPPAYAAAKLARALERTGAEVTRDPRPVTAGTTVLCPDLAVGATRIELVGFWTAEHLARKLAGYRTAGVPVVLCVDDTRACADDPVPEGAIVRFRRKIDPQEVLARCA